MAYKMKHNKGNFPFKSPLKISDAALVEAQDKLDHVELDFREPGWATVARGAHKGVKKVLKKFGIGTKEEESKAAKEGESKAQKVAGGLEGSSLVDYSKSQGGLYKATGGSSFGGI